MSKFNKLSRAEMKNVTGGIIKACSMVCRNDEGNGHYFDAVTQVPDCTVYGTSSCAGETVISCSCGTL